LRAGGLLKELMQLGTQEMLQRFKLGVTDVQIAIQADQFETQLIGDELSLGDRGFVSEGWFVHANCLPESKAPRSCKRFTFLA
jgi:hypothetical protein